MYVLSEPIIPQTKGRKAHNSNSSASGGRTASATTIVPDKHCARCQDTQYFLPKFLPKSFYQNLAKRFLILVKRFW